MKRGEVVHQTSKGRATFRWKDANGDSKFLIEFSDGRELWTNSMDIIRKELEPDGQMEMFSE